MCQNLLVYFSCHCVDQEQDSRCPPVTRDRAPTKVEVEAERLGDGYSLPKVSRVEPELPELASHLISEPLVLWPPSDDAIGKYSSGWDEIFQGGEVRDPFSSSAPSGGYAAIRAVGNGDKENVNEEPTVIDVIKMHDFTYSTMLSSATVLTFLCVLSCVRPRLYAGLFYSLDTVLAV